MLGSAAVPENFLISRVWILELKAEIPHLTFFVLTARSADSLSYHDLTTNDAVETDFLDESTAPEPEPPDTPIQTMIQATIAGGARCRCSLQGVSCVEATQLRLCFLMVLLHGSAQFVPA